MNHHTDWGLHHTTSNYFAIRIFKLNGYSPELEPSTHGHAIYGAMLAHR